MCVCVWTGGGRGEGGRSWDDTRSRHCGKFWLCMPAYPFSNLQLTVSSMYNDNNSNTDSNVRVQPLFFKVVCDIYSECTVRTGGDGV